MEEFPPFNCCLSFVFYVAWGVGVGGGAFGGLFWGGRVGELNTENSHAVFCHIK